ncbi:C40 family peptidase [Frankia nepalensis]|nr:C40 family peptidase [Frankia nepalensis]
MITTGTVAVSGVALTGSLGIDQQDPETGEIMIASALGAGDQVETAAARPTIAAAVEQPVAFQLRTAVSLAPTLPDVTVNADEPVEVGFRLTSRSGGALADQDILVQVLFPQGWTTFKALRTDASGHAAYTARVLTTTQVRATFAGSDALEAATSAPAILRVRPQPPAAPSPASDQAPRDGAGGATTAPSAVGGQTSVGEKAVYLASLQAGKPYVYGAEGPYSFDCSGLVQYVYKQLGKSLPRTTDQQFAATTRIARGSEQVGDLIFFGQPGSMYHMGIYAGNGKIWVAPKSGDVVKLQTIWASDYYVGRVS